MNFTSKYFVVMKRFIHEWPISQVFYSTNYFNVLIKSYTTVIIINISVGNDSRSYRPF